MTVETTSVTNRNAARDSLFLSADLTVAGLAKPFSVRVRNLSEGGMMVDGHPAFAEGLQVSADLRGIGMVSGQVAWAMPERAGIAFDVAIDPKDARHPVGQTKTVTYKRPPVDTTSRPGLKTR
jgi:PilZ domain